MVTELAIWMIFLLPLGSFAFAALVVRPFLNRFALLSALVTIASLGVALGILGLSPLLSEYVLPKSL